MIVRSFLTLFRLFTALTMMGQGINAYAAVNAEQITAVANEFLAAHSQQLQEQYGNIARVEYQVDRLDNRLSMADCPVPLGAELKSARNVGRINIQVSCDSQVQWTLYVPAEVKLFRPVVVLVGPVARGVKLSADDLELRDTDISQLNGSYFTALEDVIGMVARRLLKADKPVIAAQLKPPIMVAKGDAVILTANSGGLMVKMPGIALRDGRKGQQISVRNSQSNRVVEALITGPGQVEVPM